MFKSAIIRTFYLGVMFLANLLLANLLLPYHFGILTLMILNASVFSIFSGFGTDSIVLYSITNNKWSIGQALTFIRNSLSIQVALFFLLEFIWIVFFNKTFLSQNEVSFIIPEMAFFLGLILTEKLVILFYSIQKAFLANCILAFSAILFLGIILLFKFYHVTRAYSLFLLFSMQSLFQGMILLFVYLYKYNINFSKFSTENLKDAIKLSLLVMLTNIIQFFAYRIDYYIIEKYYSEFEVGVFAQSNKMANLMLIVPNILALLLIPRFNRLSPSQYQSIFKMAFLINGVLALITLLAGYSAFNYILKLEYNQGLQAFYLMIPGFFCWATVIYFGAFFSFSGKFHYNLLASTFCFFAILTSDLLLIPIYGINGAAISNTVAYSATLIIYIFLFFKCSEKGFSKIKISEFRLLINSLK